MTVPEGLENNYEDELSIKVEGVSKDFQIYEKPNDRLKQMVYPRLQRALSWEQKEYFQKFSALSEISIEVKKGEAVGIIGRNGAGKSTLLQIICGTLHPTLGSVNINGRVAALLELGSGFNPEFTGRENVFMNAAILGLTDEEIASKYDDIIAFADIGTFIDQPVKTYSSGMLVRLAFSVIAHVDADVLIVDEALSVGDAFFSQKCMRFLRNFMKNGTLLFVSHDLGAVLNLCENAIWIQDGKVFAQGKSKKVTEAYLEELYAVQSDSKKTHEDRHDTTIDTAMAPQNDADSPEGPLDKSPVKEPDFYDMRRNFVNNSNLRNDIELFSFSESAASFGEGGAKITDVFLRDDQGKPLSWVVGGEAVELTINCEIEVTVKNPIVGFQVKDRLGQVVFADNTYLTYMDDSITALSGENIVAKFQFTMPILPIGDYSISPALADGVQSEHSQKHWMHDALVFKVHATSTSLGLIGIPMKQISLEKF
jgi:lipopolysaccharide transport system ATP-binding protein